MSYHTHCLSRMRAFGFRKNTPKQLIMYHKGATASENQQFAYTITKAQTSFAVTAKLISAFVFATQIAQSFFFLNPKFQASNHLLWLYKPVCVGPGRKPKLLVFSRTDLNVFCVTHDTMPVIWQSSLEVLVLLIKSYFVTRQISIKY